MPSLTSEHTFETAIADSLTRSGGWVRGHDTDFDWAQVNAALEQGHRVGFTFVVIDPPALRLYVEEVLIKQLIAGTHWNIKSRSITKAAIR